MKRTTTIACYLFAAAAIGCGGVSSPMGDDDDDDDDTMEPDAGGGPEAPVLLSSSPANGATGVDADAAIVLTFSQPMDAASVEEMFYGPSLGAVGFVWNIEQTELTITPEESLEYAEGEGNDPSVIDAKLYEMAIGSAAVSAEGVNLTENAVVSFTTSKRMSTVLAFDPALTRHVTDGASMSSDGEDLHVGDSSTNKATRALITFDMSPLPATAQTIESATLASLQVDFFGTPYDIGLSVNAYHLTFADVLVGFAAPAMSAAGPASGSEIAEVALDVTEKVADDLAQRAARADRSQYRLQFESNHNNDSSPDFTVYSLADTELKVVYLAP